MKQVMTVFRYTFKEAVHKKSFKIKDFCVRVQNCCPIMAPPAQLEPTTLSP